MGDKLFVLPLAKIHLHCQFDRLVYELYELTEEEIATVEGRRGDLLSLG